MDVTFWEQELDARHIELSENLSHLIEVQDRIEKQINKFYYPLQIAQKCVELR